MKKVLALVLAVVLCLGMTTVAFAATVTKATDISLIEGNSYTLFTLDGKAMIPFAAAELTPDTTYYIAIDAEVGANDVLDSGREGKIATYSDLRLRTDITDGAAYVSSKPSIVIKKASIAQLSLAAEINRPFITFKTSDKFNKEPVDINFSIDVYKKGTPGLSNITFSGSVSYQTADAAGSFTVAKSGNLVDFGDVEDTEIYFGDSDVVFEVNAKGQKDLFLRMDTSDDALTDKYPDADLSIYKFAGNNKTFKRTGTLTIPADMVENKDGKMVAPVLYNYEGGKLTVNKDAKYNEEKSAFEIKTSKLGNYVVAGTALPASAPSTDGTEEPAAPGTVPNPDTGANDFVGLAVALAVVSVAGIAVAKRK